jgi:hypothetical protein
VASSTVEASNTDLISVAGYDLSAMDGIQSALPVSQNEILNGVINKIGKSVISRTNTQDPFNVFNKGTLDYGQTVETIWTGLIDAEGYDGENVDEQFKQKYVEAKAAYHPLDFRLKYRHSVSRDRLRRAFSSETGLAALVNDLMGKPMDSARRDHFLLLKYLIYNQIINGRVKTVKFARDAEPLEISKTIQSYSNKFTFLSSDFTMAGVETDCPKERQYLITTADFDAKLNHDVLANAFNMDKVEWMGHRIMVDNFNPIYDLSTSTYLKANHTRLTAMLSNAASNLWTDTTGGSSTGDNKNLTTMMTPSVYVDAVLVDEEFFVDYVAVDEMASNYNPDTLTENFFYHVWRVIACNPFRNIIAFSRSAA